MKTNMVGQSDLSDLEKNLMVAQEISFAKVLAGNDKKLRDRGVKKLKKWLAIRSQGKSAFTEDDFQRIWTGLFYCMWMSDKLLVQEELAESISHLIHCFRNNSETALLFIKCFHKIMNVEWSGLDQYRIDKFNMLSRRFLRQSLEYCKRKEWNVALVKRLIELLEELILDANNPNGYSFHFIDIYLEELAKVSKGKLNPKMVSTLLEPFVKMGGRSKDARLVEVLGLFFRHLMSQTDVGILYEEKLRAWKQKHFPSKSPEDLELVPLRNGHDEEGDSDELEDMIADTALDPRAGETNAVLPQIPLSVDSLLSLIKKYQEDKFSTNRGKRFLRDLESKFSNLKRGRMSEGIKKPSILNTVGKKKKLTLKCAKDLLRYTENLDDEEMDVDEEEVDDEGVVGEVDDEGVVGEVVEPGKKNNKKKKGRGKKKPSGDDGGEKNVPEEVAVAEAEPAVEDSKPDKAEKAKKTKKKKKKKKVKQNGVVEAESPERIEAPSKADKPKSPAEGFTVEEVSDPSPEVGNKRKRTGTGSSSWLVDDLDVNSEEYKEVKIPKIIRLEVKVDDPSLAVEASPSVRPPKDEAVESQTTPLTPVFWEKAKAKAMAKTKKKKSRDVFLNPFHVGDESAKNARRISFALDRNGTQENDDYLAEVKNSPSIPFDGNRKPIQSVLKSGLSPSPINPFYRFRRK